VLSNMPATVIKPSGVCDLFQPSVLLCDRCDRKKSNVAYMKEHGFANEMLDGLLNLDLALQCDAFVGGVSSNWAR